MDLKVDDVVMQTHDSVTVHALEGQMSLGHGSKPVGLAPKRLHEDDSTSSNMDENGPELPSGLSECYFRDEPTMLKPLNLDGFRKGK